MNKIGAFKIHYKTLNRSIHRNHANENRLINIFIGMTVLIYQLYAHARKSCAATHTLP